MDDIGIEKDKLTHFTWFNKMMILQKQVFLALKTLSYTFKKGVYSLK